jgi:hypothetical protein
MIEGDKGTHLSTAASQRHIPVVRRPEKPALQPHGRSIHGRPMSFILLHT